MQIGSWHGHEFTVSPAVVRGFTELTLKGSAETSDKTSSKQKYVARKNSKPMEMSILVGLHASLGVDVRGEALAFVQEACDGVSDYFYLSGSKLLPCQVMLTQAEVENTEISPAGVWVYCEVKLTLKQASKGEAAGSTTSSSSSSGGSSSKKKSTKSGSTKTTSKTTSANPNATNASASKSQTTVKWLSDVIAGAKKTSKQTSVNAR